jgi:hypothetical protein
MTDIQWDGGTDNFNQVALRTNDSNDDDVIDIGDEADDTDGIADTWITSPFVNRSVIPPPDPADDDEELAAWLLNSGLGALRWGDERPIFTHPDAEASWRIAQRLYFSGNNDAFEETFDSGQVLTVEERQQMVSAMRAIEDVTNITFLQRPDLPAVGAPPGFTLIPPPNNGYPVNAVGYTLDPSGVAVDPGGILGLPGASEFPWQPEDDYPWILIAKGGNPALAEDGPTGSTIVGNARNLPFAASIDYFLTDLDGDGFPGHARHKRRLSPRSDHLEQRELRQHVPGQWRSHRGPQRPGLGPQRGGGWLRRDAAGGGARRRPRGPPVGPGDRLPPVRQLPVRPELRRRRGPDPRHQRGRRRDRPGASAISSSISTPTARATPSSGAPVASPIPFPSDAIPCELMGITQAAFDNQDIGAIVYQLMRHLGFLNEHQRPDREDFVRVNFDNIDSNFLPGFALITSGTDRYANFIENFDTTTSTIPPAPPFTPRLPGAWTISGAPTSGPWSFAVPAPGDDPAPIEDFAVDEDDMSAEALVTGITVGQRLVGETVFTSPAIYGPEDAMVTFAYFLNSDTPAPLQTGDGLIVESSPDGGVTWDELTTLTVPNADWREVSVVVGDVRNDGATEIPDFLVRFTARNTDAGRAVEMGLDRIRVQNPYDFLSIMHFGTFAASIFPGERGFESIEVREPNTADFQDLIGLAQGLSLGDRIGLSNLYGDPVTPDGDEPAPDPCRADVSGDGVIDAIDVTLFLELYNAGDMQADFAPEFGVIDIFDLVQFFVDAQNSFRCQNDPDNNFGSNNFSDLTPG